MHFKNARWSHALAHGSVSACGLRSTSKILPRSAQILIVIGKAFAMHVNARGSNHDPNHVLDRDPKRLSERGSIDHVNTASIMRICRYATFCATNRNYDFNVPVIQRKTKREKILEIYV